MKAICEDAPNTILVLGPSGSGKDTQISKLVERCGYEQIGTGEMFRDAYERKTPKGIAAYEYWSVGKWVPDDLVYEVFAEWLKRYDPKAKWIFSQVVRAPGQVARLDELLSTYNRKLDLVISFRLSEEAAIERMSLRRHCPKCGREYNLKYVKPKNGEHCDDDGEKLVARDDDKPDAIRKRLKEFEEKTRPVIEAYRARGIIVEIDATPPIDDVWESVKKTLNLDDTK